MHAVIYSYHLLPQRICVVLDDVNMFFQVSNAVAMTVACVIPVNVLCKTVTKFTIFLD